MKGFKNKLKYYTYCHFKALKTYNNACEILSIVTIMCPVSGWYRCGNVKLILMMVLISMEKLKHFNTYIRQEYDN
jgi:hypothetical protein